MDHEKSFSTPGKYTTTSTPSPGGFPAARLYTYSSSYLSSQHLQYAAYTYPP